MEPFLQKKIREIGKIPHSLGFANTLTFENKNISFLQKGEFIKYSMKNFC